MTPRAEPPRLCLVVEAGCENKDARACVTRIEKALAEVAVASLVVSRPGDEPFNRDMAQRLISLAQSAGAAALVADDCDLALSVGADGVHLSWQKDIEGAYRAARERLGAERIVGVDVGRSRHDAMTLGELGADYVGFSIPPFVEDREKARSRRLDLVGWWGEIFEVPVVAFDVETALDIKELVAAGADFVAPHVSVAMLAGSDPRGDLDAWLGELAAALNNPLSPDRDGTSCNPV